jgi:hypothetical protein
MPKTTNQSVLAGQAAAQGDNATQRVILGYQTKLRTLGVKMTPDLAKAIRLKGLQSTARAKQPKTVHGRLAGDLNALVQVGEMDPKVAAETIQEAKGMSEYTLAQRIGKSGLAKAFDPNGVLARIDRAALRKSRGG